MVTGQTEVVDVFISLFLVQSMQNELIVYFLAVFMCFILIYSHGKQIKKKFLEYCKHCTLHGAYYFYSSSNKWIHLLWWLIIASSFALCAFLCHMIWGKFIVDPTFTVVETTHYPTEKISFPAVSICDTESVYIPNTNNITEVLRLRGFENNHINEFYRSITDVKQRGYEIKAHIKKMHGMLENLGYNYETLLDMLKKPCEVLIQECKWRAKAIDCSIMFRSVFTFNGYCCQFDIFYFRSRAEKQTNFAAGTEITEALDIRVNTKQISASGHTSEGYALVYVFNKENKMTILDSAITVTSDTYFDVTIDVWLMDSSKDVNDLSLQNRKCILKTDLDFEATSRQNCVMNIVIKKVSERCRCIPFKYGYNKLDVEELRPCVWNRLPCVYEALENVQGNIRDVVSENECYPNCNLVQFATEVKYLKQIRATGENQSNSRISVHFEDKSCMKYRREVLYTWDQMLANLGGIFGLCLGGSIISIIEILWLLSDLLYTCCIGLKTRHVAPRSDNIYTLSNKMNNSKTEKKEDVACQRYKFMH